MDGCIDRYRWLSRQTQQEREQDIKRQGRSERKMNGELYKWMDWQRIG